MRANGPARQISSRHRMIISRTPLRLSFVGGGSDLPDFYERHGGAVVSTTMDKWIHVIVARRFEEDVRVSYSRTEIVPNARAVEHELAREAMRMTGVPRGVDIVTLADVPSHGSGVGSSSSVTVGLLNALYAFQGVYKSPLQLAEEAAKIEIGILGSRSVAKTSTPRPWEASTSSSSCLEAEGCELSQ